MYARACVCVRVTVSDVEVFPSAGKLNTFARFSMIFENHLENTLWAAKSETCSGSPTILGFYVLNFDYGI